MSNGDILKVLLKVDAGPEADDSMAAAIVHRLRQDLLRLDVEDVELVPRTETPAGAKGADFDWTKLLVSVGSAGGILAKLMATLQSWLSYDQRRSVTLEIAGDKLAIQGVSSAEQKRLVDAWLRRHR